MAKSLRRMQTSRNRRSLFCTTISACYLPRNFAQSMILCRIATTVENHPESLDYYPRPAVPGNIPRQSKGECKPRNCTPVWLDAYNALQDALEGKYYVDQEIIMAAIHIDFGRTYRTSIVRDSGRAPKSQRIGSYVDLFAKIVTGW